MAAGYLNTYRALISDLVLVTMAEVDAPHAALATALRACVRPGTPVIRAVLRPRPLEPVAGERIAYFCTAPAASHEPLAAHLEDRYDARVAHVSGALSDRARLRQDLQGIDADVFLVELKAAAVDVVVEEAVRRGIRVVIAANDVVPLHDEVDLDSELERLAAEATALVPEIGLVSERRYLAPLPLGGDDGPPWSKGLLSRALAATGLGATRSYELAVRADADLAERETDRLDLDRLTELAAEVLGEAEGGRTMRRLRRLHALRQLDVPIVLLVGGATGTGKSTIATEAAHRLGITRVTSTDFIRQTLRAYFSPAFMPAVHYSSFEAGLGLTKAEEEEAGDAHLLGFLDQTRNVLVGVEAAIDRSLAEGWSMVLEGVHLVPGMVDVDRAGRDRRAVRHRDRGRGSPPEPFLGAGPRDGRAAAAGEVPRRDARDPSHPGRARRAGAAVRRAGDPQRDARPGDGRGPRPRPLDRRPSRARLGCATVADCICTRYSRATEWAALAGARWLGRADEEAAEDAAANGMRAALDELPIDGRDRDRLPDGRGAVAGRPGRRRRRAHRPRARPDRGPGCRRARAVSARWRCSPPRHEGALRHLPDMYMRSIAVGPRARAP